MAGVTDGGTPRRQQVRAEPAPTTPDPIEIAMEAEAENLAPDSPARRVLVKHEKLIGWQIAGERAGFALKVLTGLAGLAMAVALGLMALQASRAEGVVIEPFSVPPELAARGLTGQVLAAQLQDRLSRLQAATYSVRPEASYSSGWGDEISVEIPSTGVSLGELQRFLRGWLGRETRIGGDAYRTADGRLAVTVRAAGGAGDEVTGAEAELPTLLQGAAEKLYARTQPYRYAMYLQNQGRTDEARGVLGWLADNGTGQERAWSLAGLSRVEPDNRRALARARLATELAPELAEAWDARSRAASRMGLQPEEVAGLERFIALLKTRNRGGYSEQATAARMRAEEVLAIRRGDYLEARRFAQTTRRDGGNSTIRARALTSMAFDSAMLHEATLARRYVASAALETQPRDMTPGQYRASLERVLQQAAAGIEDWPLAQRHGELGMAALRADPGALSPEQLSINGAWPLQVRSLVFLGRLDEAGRMASDLPMDCMNCLLARATVAEALGDRTAARRWYDATVRFNPNDWGPPERRGVMLLRFGRDPEGAIAAFRRAAELSPFFADPLEGWGEALMAKGDYRAAIKKFEQAAQRAPRWGRLHLQWGMALAKLGKTDEARVKWRAAATMDLSAAERARVSQLLARAA